ncbi:MAG: serine hydrolase [Flavobacteriales bacterium]|nr:serine hydrolase [Flavobacteriales bacterium]
MHTRLTTFLLLISSALSAQEIYFPPNEASAGWETVDPASLGWCEDQIPPLIDFIEESNSKAFIVLKDGRIAIEHYVGTFTQDSVWYWASAGKSLTAFLVGTAQEDGLLDINEPSSNYLGTGWTSCTPEQEAAITVRNQLTMTTGLDDGTGDLDCTDPACLQYLAPPGTRWAYYNAPYTKLDGVIAAATGSTLNSYVYNTLGQTTGMLGLYLTVGANNVFFSTPRNMARFGLLAMNNGNWNGTPIMSDADYFHDMVTPSQTLNESYGYLWWLNGQDSYKLPGLQVDFPGPLMPDAPMEAYNAMGKNGQVINVVPSQGLVVIRMGNLPGGIFVPNVYNNEIWQHLNAVICNSTGIADGRTGTDLRPVFPVPANDLLHVELTGSAFEAVEAIGMDGRRHPLTWSGDAVNVQALDQGAYILRMGMSDGSVALQRFLIVR